MTRAQTATAADALPRRPRGPSTQDWLDLESIRDGVVFLRGRRQAAVLEVRPINLLLLTREEQDARLAAFRTFLNGLGFPIQIVYLNEPLRLDGYFADLERQAGEAPADGIRLLILAQKRFVADLATSTRPVRRRIFVAVWDEIGGGTRRVGPSLHRQGPTGPAGEPQASRRLAERRAQLAGAVQGMGLQAHWLTDDELADLLVRAFGAGPGLPRGG